MATSEYLLEDFDDIINPDDVPGEFVPIPEEEPPVEEEAIEGEEGEQAEEPLEGDAAKEAEERALMA